MPAVNSGAASRVAVQLTPKHGDGLFIFRLRENAKNPKLRIDNVRRSKDLNMVIEHCKRRWQEHLVELGNPPLQLYMHPSSEWHFHTEIYRRRPDVNAVVHTHSMYAGTLACARQPADFGERLWA